MVASFITFNGKIKYKDTEFNKATDGIAVLTGGKGRISLGLNLLNKNKDLKLIISGVDKKVARASIIPDNFDKINNITLDKEAESTFQNALVVKKWIEKYKLKKVTVITSYYHMPRSMLLMKLLSPDINFYPYPVEKNFSKKLSLTKHIAYYFFLIEEYIKYLMSYFIFFFK
tara:strand:- start:38185 stop:38700 length:516 start_codon:yes stop_codon:yes gene_type:complete